MYCLRFNKNKKEEKGEVEKAVYSNISYDIYLETTNTEANSSNYYSL